MQNDLGNSLKVSLGILILLVCMTGVEPAIARVVERSDLTSLAVRAEEERGLRNLHVSVSMFDSLRIFGKPKVITVGETMRLLIPLHVVGGAGKVAGHTEFFIPLPSSIKKVTFGKLRVEIWPNGVEAERLEPEAEHAKQVALAQFNEDFPKTDSFYVHTYVTRYGSANHTTYLRSTEPGYEVVVNYPAGRVIYQISSGDYKIIDQIRQ